MKIPHKMFFDRLIHALKTPYFELGQVFMIGNILLIKNGSNFSHTYCSVSSKAMMKIPHKMFFDRLIHALKTPYFELGQVFMIGKLSLFKRNEIRLRNKNGVVCMISIT